MDFVAYYPSVKRNIENKIKIYLPPPVLFFPFWVGGGKLSFLFSFLF